MRKKYPHIAIVHDHLRTYGGGERVLEALHKIWPQAPVFVATADLKRLGEFAKKFSGFQLQTSWAQKFPPFVKKPLLYRLLLRFIWSSFDLGSFDIIISSSGSNISKGVTLPPSALHICYCHTPPRYLYGLETESWFSTSLTPRFFLSPILRYLRSYDQKTSSGVHFFIANSKTVANRIKKHYHQESTIIYPPCGFLGQKKILTNGKYFLVVSRLVRYKHIDLIVEACSKQGKKLIVVGDGPDRLKLMKRAGKSISFVGSVADGELKKYYQYCRALIVASQNEDFGMVAVEAMSFGKPVIAYHSGGLRETVIPNKTGLFFHQLTSKNIERALRRFEKMSFNPILCRKRAALFSDEVFIKKMKTFVDTNWLQSIKLSRQAKKS